jgi:uncharacterized peroxidase-related enzyme
VADLYADFARRMQFPAPPNFIMTQGHSVAVVRGTWGLVQNVLVGGEIPRWTKELIFVAISLDRNCRYCAAAHIACCRMLGVHPGVCENMVRNIDNHSDPKLRDTIAFARKCARDPQSLTAADHKTLFSHGYTQSQVVEVVSMSALAVYANIMADATAMENDEMFDRL